MGHLNRIHASRIKQESDPTIEQNISQKTFGLPFRKYLKVEGRQESFTIGEYLIPQTCCWFYSNIKEPLGSIVKKHECMWHPMLRGTPILDCYKRICLKQNPWIELMQPNPRKIKILEEELESLAVITQITQESCLYPQDVSAILEWVINTSPPPLLVLFASLMATLERKFTNLLKLNLSIASLVIHVPFILEGEGSNLVAPGKFFIELEEKVRKFDGKMDVNDFFGLVKELLQEKGWVSVPPRLVRLFSSLEWASSFYEFYENGDERSVCMLRNFVESVFWIPVNIYFTVNPWTLCVEREKIIDTLSGRKLSDEAETVIGELTLFFTRNLIENANALATHRLGEELLLLKVIPRLTSQYIRLLANDRRSSTPKIFPKPFWEKPCGQLYEFLEKYNWRRFEKFVKSEIVDAFYYPEDCLTKVEERASENICKLEGLKDILFTK